MQDRDYKNQILYKGGKSGMNAKNTMMSVLEKRKSCHEWKRQAKSRVKNNNSVTGGTHPALDGEG